MLFPMLPFWANLAIVVLALVAKYFLIRMIEKSVYFKDNTVNKGWVAYLNIISVLNGALTAAILLIPAGKGWALLIGVLDIILHWVLGYWKIKKMMPKLSQDNVDDALAWFSKVGKWIASIHVATYVSVGTWLVNYVQSNPGLLTKLLSLVHLA